jgi:hypothetical protein
LIRPDPRPDPPALAAYARGSIERGLAATISHRDLIFLNAGRGEN